MMSSDLIIYNAKVSALQMCVNSHDLQAIKDIIRRQEHDVDNQFFTMTFAKGQLVYGMTALHVAVAIQSRQSVHILLEMGADVNAITGYPFGREIKIRNQPNPYLTVTARFTPLHMAVINNNEDICQLLISHNADVNALDHKEKTPLEYSMKNSRLALLLIQSGADYNSDYLENKPLIFKAIKKKNLDLIRFFGREQVRGVYYENKSPVEFAMTHFPEAVPLLISFGKQLYFANDRTGDYPIHIAVRQKNKEWIKLLCQKGCDPNVRDSNYNRALHIAVQNQCSPEIVLILISFKADPNLKNYWGVTPLSLATQMGNEELTDIFLRMNARLSRNMEELKRALRFKKFNTAAIILRQYTSMDHSLRFDGDHILWFFVKQCVGVSDANHKTMANIMSKLVAISPIAIINSIDNIWGTLMHFLIYADVCSPANCYRPLFTALIRSLKCIIDKEFSPSDTVLANNELIVAERIMANGSALSFALEMNDCEYYAEELIRLGADHSTIKWDQIYFHPKKVKALKLLVYVGCAFPDNFRQYADPTLDDSIANQDVDLINKEFDQFMEWWDVRRTTPLSLKQKSRNTIRKAIGSLGCRLLDTEGSLVLGTAFHPYPKTLVQYILFRSEDSLDI